MSVRLYINNKEILHVKNSTFETLYEEMLKIVENKNLNDSLEDLFTILFNATRGVDMDIDEYLTTKSNLMVFNEILKEAIERFEKKFLDLSEESKKRLWNFHNELVKYADDLE